MLPPWVHFWEEQWKSLWVGGAERRANHIALTAAQQRKKTELSVQYIYYRHPWAYISQHDQVITAHLYHSSLWTFHSPLDGQLIYDYTFSHTRNSRLFPRISAFVHFFLMTLLNIIKDTETQRLCKEQETDSGVLQLTLGSWLSHVMLCLFTFAPVCASLKQHPNVAANI